MVPQPNVFEFGPFRLNARERLLLRDGKPIALTPKAFDALLMLVQNSGRLLEKDEILRHIWPDTFVEEATLAQNIFTLRRALGKSPEEKQYIETVPKRGYRFAASVRSQSTTQESQGLTENPTTADPESPASGPSPAELSALRARRGRGKTVIGFDSGIWKALASLLVLGLAAGVYRLFTSKPLRQPEVGASVRSIAILPFESLNSESADDYLGVGMADALITKLSNVKQLVVRPTSAVLQSKARKQSLLDSGRELKVDLVLEGKIQRVGDRMRVTVQLLTVPDGSPIWADKFDEQFKDIFTLQDSVSEEVTRALTLRLTNEERQLVMKRYTANTDAYQAYLQGRYHWSSWREDEQTQAIEFFKRAIEIDPRYALGYAGLADSYSILALNGYLSPQDAMPKMRDAAVEALKLDDTLSEAHAALAAVILFYDWDPLSAEKEFKRAIDLNPRYVTAHLGYGLCLLALERFSDAIAEMETAQEIDPFSYVVDPALGWSYYLAHRPDQALEQYQRAIAREQASFRAHNYLGQAYEQKRMYAEAIAEFLKAKSLSEGDLEPLVGLGHAYAVSARKQEALEIIDELKKRSRAHYVSPYYLAVLYAGLAQEDVSYKSQAFEWLDKAADERVGWMIYVRINPLFDGLRSELKFINIVKRVGPRSRDGG